MEAPRMMVVEDDEHLGFLIRDYFSGLGWEVQLCATAETGTSAFHSHQFDLCVLDVMLPGMTGFDLAAEIRKYNQVLPIVFLTAKSQIADRIRGFQTGADDYVCKPFSIDEFRYRLESILRRATGMPAAKTTILKAGKSTLDVQNLELTANGKLIRLTNKECRVLQLLFRHAGDVVERQVFLKSVWADDGFFVARSMDVFVSKLRKYLKPDPTLSIKNVRGVGYILGKSSG